MRITTEKTATLDVLTYLSALVKVSFSTCLPL